MGKLTGILIGIIIFLIIVAGIVGILIVSDDKIMPNITIEDIDVGKLTKEEALQKLKASTELSTENLVIKLKFKDKAWDLSYKELAFTYDFDKAVEEAYNVGREDSFIKKIIDTVNSRFVDHSFKIDFSYNDQKVNELIDSIGTSIDQEAIDSTIKYVKPDFKLTDDQYGFKLNREKAIELVIKDINAKLASEIGLPVDITEPTIKRTDLENIRDVLGEFSTKFNAADVDRTHNIRIATASATHILLHPGEIYSVNQVVGPRLQKFGFKEAKVIINNELVPGIGGGVCQVSSTLYNAALLSNLKIVERRNHSLPLSYVAIGRDATISGDYIDFKFQNSTPYPLYIYGEVEGSWVKFSVFGRNDYPDRKVRIETETVKTVQPATTIIEDVELLEGTEVEEKKASTGYVVKSYRIITENGKQIFKEALYTDTYKVVDGVKRVGTKKGTVENNGGTPATDPYHTD